MPNIPDANRVTLFRIDGKSGYWQKIKRQEAKQDGHKQHVIQAIYGDGSLGYFVPVVIENPKETDSQPAPVPATSASTPQPLSAAAADASNS